MSIYLAVPETVFFRFDFVVEIVLLLTVKFCSLEILQQTNV